MVLQTVFSLRQFISSIDAELVRYYQIGLGIGILVITTLAVFPGKPFGIEYGKEVSVKAEEDTKFDDPSEHDAVASGPLTAVSREEWAGNHIPQEALHEVRKQYGLTTEQMKQAIEDARCETRIETSAWNMHRVLNSIVYIITLSVLVYVLNRDYDYFVGFWFGRFFPKEAETLGLFLPERRAP